MEVLGGLTSFPFYLICTSLEGNSLHIDNHYSPFSRVLHPRVKLRGGRQHVYQKRRFSHVPAARGATRRG
jgi:hypothetical protein